MPPNILDPNSNPWLSMMQSQNANPGPAMMDPELQTALNQDSIQAAQTAPAQDQSSGAVAPSAPQDGSPQINMGAMNKLLAGLNLKNTEGYGTQKDALDRLQKYRDQMPQGAQGIDLSPLMAYSDSVSGGHLASSYKAPATAQERAAQAAGVDEAIQKIGQGMSAEDLSLLKDKIMGETAKLHFGLLGQQKSDAKASAAITGAQKSLNNQDYQKTQKSIDDLDNTHSMIDEATSNPVAYNLVPVTLAKAIVAGAGKLNQPEIQAAGGSKAIVEKLTQVGEEMKDGTLTEANQKYMHDLVNVLQKGQASHLEKLRTTAANQFVQSHGGDADTAYQKITGSPRTKPDAAPTSNSGATGMVDVIDENGQEGQIPAANLPAALKSGIYRRK